MRKLLFVFIVTFLVIACKKDSFQLSYPSLYYANGIKDIQPLRAFTVNGEIKDKAVIGRIETANSFYITPEEIKNLPYIFDSIQFSSGSEAKLFGLYINNRDFNMSQNGNDLTLTSLTADHVERDTTVTTKILIASLYYPALYSNKSNPSGPFYWYDFTEQHFARLSSTNELIIPAMVMLVIAPLNTVGVRPTNNRFNPGFDYKLLGGSNDTFAVREYSLIMRKAHQ